MDRLIRTLIERLVAKGVEISTVPAFVRNLANTIAGNPHIHLSELNERLHLLGWHGIDLDDYTLQLILATFESDVDASGPSDPAKDSR